MRMCQLWAIETLNASVELFDMFAVQKNTQKFAERLSVGDDLQALVDFKQEITAAAYSASELATEAGAKEHEIPMN